MATEKPEKEAENLEEMIRKQTAFFEESEKIWGHKPEELLPSTLPKYHYGNLLDHLDFLLEESEDYEMIEACQGELDRRWVAYKTWKEKNVPEEDRHKIPMPLHLRPFNENPIIIKASITWDDVISQLEDNSVSVSESNHTIHRLLQYTSDESEC